MEFGQDAEMEANDMKMKAKDVYVDADRVIHREIFHRKVGWWPWKVMSNC